VFAHKLDNATNASNASDFAQKKKENSTACAKAVADSLSLSHNDSNDSANVTSLAKAHLAKKEKEHEVTLTIGQDFVQKNSVHSTQLSLAQQVTDAFHSARTYLRQMLGFKH
jgi:hypothetical protein